MLIIRDIYNLYIYVCKRIVCWSSEECQYKNGSLCIYIYICMYIYLMFGNMNDGEKRGRMEKTGRRLMLI